MDDLASLLSSAWGLPAPQINPSSQGADRNSRLFEVRDSSGARRVLKWRRGPVNHAALRLPLYMGDSGAQAFLAPVETSAGELHVPVSGGYLALLPHIDGHDAFERPLNAGAWRQLGQALRTLHDAQLPGRLRRTLPQDGFDTQSLVLLRQLLDRPLTSLPDPAARQLDKLLRVHKATLSWLMDQSNSLALQLRRRDLPVVPCHGDIHAGNVLVDSGNQLFLVDFDTLQLAARARDLMFVGAGVAGHWQGEQECAWFYEGYGPAQPDPEAIAFYRCERIVADVLDYSRQILNGGTVQEREFALAELQRQLAQGPELLVARASVEALA
ncbi:MAG: aminoglycoside phosphotransferase family protein [Anaerolineae bacterium]|nr:aminoglycoside phosphotransferase family protein [Anaerolineae bacterium]